jgi:hypothetical protein
MSTSYHSSVESSNSPREFCGGLLTGLNGDMLRIVEIRDDSLLVLDMRTNQVREIIKEENNK